MLLSSFWLLVKGASPDTSWFCSRILVGRSFHGDFLLNEDFFEFLKFNPVLLFFSAVPDFGQRSVRWVFNDFFRCAQHGAVDFHHARLLLVQGVLSKLLVVSWLSQTITLSYAPNASQHIHPLSFRNDK